MTNPDTHADVTGAGWRPIETAPRDGTPIDLWLGNTNSPRRMPDCVWSGGLNRCFVDAQYHHVPNLSVTHWQPLPPPPGSPATPDPRIDAVVEAEREACAQAVEKKAALLDKQECCGFGQGSPPECCGDPLYMISSVDAAAAIRARSEKEGR